MIACMITAGLLLCIIWLISEVRISNYPPGSDADKAIRDTLKEIERMYEV